MPDSDILIRLAALEKENAALRSMLPAQPPQPPPQQSDAPRPPSKMDMLLASLREAALELAKENDPAGDAIAQTAGRTQALAKVVASLVTAVGGGFGATGQMLAKLNEGISRHTEEIATLQGFVGTSAPAPAASETIEVDDTGAEAPRPPVPPAHAKPNGGAAARRVAASPVGPPVGPPPAPAPAGMPAEVAQLEQVPAASVVSVTVKP